jgi:hypothetical protein
VCTAQYCAQASIAGTPEFAGADCDAIVWRCFCDDFNCTSIRLGLDRAMWFGCGDGEAMTSGLGWSSAAAPA